MFFTGNNSGLVKKYPARYIPYILGLKVDADIAVFNYWWGKARANTKMRHSIYQVEVGYGDFNHGRMYFFVVGNTSLMTVHPETILDKGISLKLAMLFRAQQRAAPEEIIELEPIPQTVATTTSPESRAAAAAPAAAAAAAAVVLASEASSMLNDGNARASGSSSATDGELSVRVLRKRTAPTV